MSDQKQPDLPSNSFLTVLQRKELQESLMTEASTLLGELALAVKQTGKKGSLTLVLSLEPEKDAISVGTELKLKAPSTAPQHLTIFFVSDDGSLTRDNKEQKELPLTAHDGGKVDEAETTTAATAEA